MHTYSALELSRFTTLLKLTVAQACFHGLAWHRLKCLCVQSIIFLYLFFILATGLVFACWVLAGFALIGNKAFDETCEMMQLHAAGQKNQWVLENLPCDELAKAGDAVSEAQVGGNAAVESANGDIESMLLDVLPKLCRFCLVASYWAIQCLELLDVPCRAQHGHPSLLPHL